MGCEDYEGAWSIYDMNDGCWRWGLTLADAVEIERRNASRLAAMEELDDSGYTDDESEQQRGATTGG
jgi:hypothetical protein